MTTEEDFQRIIDATPDDWQTRMVFADWLDDRGDPRAAGYRAIAVQQRRPLQGKYHDSPTWWWYCPPADAPHGSVHNTLPRDWFELLPGGRGNESFWPVYTSKSRIASRRECEDALARAFAKLPAARQAELLSPKRGKSRK